MKDKFGEATVLVYATNQVVGAAADKLVFSVRKDHSIHLDVRDQNWFLERVNSSRSREMAAEALAAEIVDPFLASEGVTSSKAQALTSPEARAACVYLALQWEDDTREKGLTRLCFEGLVRSVLRDTDSDHRMPRAEIHRRVRELLPGHPETTVGQPIDSALVRLTKRFLRHWRADDEFCLTFEERQRVASRLADVEHADDQLQAALLDCVTQASEHVKPPVSLGLDELAASTRLVIDRVLWRRKEIFASAVSRGDADVEYPELVDVARNVAREIGTNPATVDARLANILTTAAGSALIDPGDLEFRRLGGGAR